MHDAGANCCATTRMPNACKRSGAAPRCRARARTVRAAAPGAAAAPAFRPGGGGARRRGARRGQRLAALEEGDITLEGILGGGTSSSPSAPEPSVAADAGTAPAIEQGSSARDLYEAYSGGSSNAADGAADGAADSVAEGVTRLRSLFSGGSDAAKGAADDAAESVAGGIARLRSRFGGGDEPAPAATSEPAPAEAPPAPVAAPNLEAQPTVEAPASPAIPDDAISAPAASDAAAPATAPTPPPSPPPSPPSDDVPDITLEGLLGSGPTSSPPSMPEPSAIPTTPDVSLPTPPPPPPPPPTADEGTIGLSSGAKDLYDSYAGTTKGGVGGSGEGVGSRLQDFTSNLNNGRPFEGASADLNAIGQDAADKAKAAAGDAAAGVGATFRALTDAASGGARGISDAVSDVVGGAASAQASFVQALSDAEAAAEAAWGSAPDAAGALPPVQAVGRAFQAFNARADTIPLLRNAKEGLMGAISSHPTEAKEALGFAGAMAIVAIVQADRGGFGGFVTPQEAFDELQREGRGRGRGRGKGAEAAGGGAQQDALLVDLRDEAARELDGIVELKLAARQKVQAVPLQVRHSPHTFPSPSLFPRSLPPHPFTPLLTLCSFSLEIQDPDDWFYIPSLPLPLSLSFPFSPLSLSLSLPFSLPFPSPSFPFPFPFPCGIQRLGMARAAESGELRSGASLRSLEVELTALVVSNLATIDKRRTKIFLMAESKNMDKALARKVARKLRDLGCANPCVVRGGYRAWQDAGLPWTDDAADYQKGTIKIVADRAEQLQG